MTILSGYKKILRFSFQLFFMSYLNFNLSFSKKKKKKSFEWINIIKLQDF
jgi:hypothetical protein